MRSEQSRGQARTWWWRAATVAALVGWVAALLTTPPSALIASAVVFTAFSLLISAGLETTRENRGGSAPATGDWRRLVDHTVLGTVGAMAALGLLQVSVGATVVVGVVLGATAAWAFSWRVTSLGEQAAQPATSRGAVPAAALGPALPESQSASASDAGLSSPVPEVTSMSVSELVLAWRRSYSQLMRVRTPQQLAALAGRRQQLLDELERRDGAGVERWLRSGARAASDPSRFLQRPTGPSASSA